MSEFWKDKNVFVTGGTGFIGTWLVKELVDNGANVVCLVKELPKNSNFNKLKLHEKTNLLVGDILDFNSIKLFLEKYQIDTVFHLAAQPLVQIALKEPFETIDINVRGTLNLLEICRLNDRIKRIVIASSDKAYGSSDVLPYDESFPLKGEYPYDVSKSCTDLLAQCYGKTYCLPVAITRLSNVYGGGDLNFDRIVPETIMHILNNEDILIRSDGKFKREFFYVKDAAHAYVALAEKIQELGLKGEAFNFGVDEPLEIINLVQKIIKASKEVDSNLSDVGSAYVALAEKVQELGLKGEAFNFGVDEPEEIVELAKNMIKASEKVEPNIRILNSVKAEIKDQYLSSKKAREILNWEPKYTLEEGLKESYKWYKEYFGK